MTMLFVWVKEESSTRSAQEEHSEHADTTSEPCVTDRYTCYTPILRALLLAKVGLRNMVLMAEFVFATGLPHLKY